VHVRPYQTFDAFMERSMCFYQTFDAFIRRSMETLEPLGNSTIKRSMSYIERSMNLKIQQFLTRRSSSINKTLTPPFHCSPSTWSSENVCECVRKSVWRRRRLLGFGGIYLSLVCFSVVIYLLLSCLVVVMS
jgi:hypothetical protein